MIQYAVWILAAMLYSPVFFQLYTYRWETIDYTHAYFILPLCLFILWQKRQELAAEYRSQSSSAGAGPIEMFAQGGGRFQWSDLSGMIALVLALLMFILGWREGYIFISS